MARTSDDDAGVGREVFLFYGAKAKINDKLQNFFALIRDCAAPLNAITWTAN